MAQQVELAVPAKLAIGGEVELELLKVDRGCLSVGITAPRHLAIRRPECHGAQKDRPLSAEELAERE